MSAAHSDRELAAAAARIKQATKDHQTRAVWTLGTLFVLGLVVGISVWFAQAPMDRDEMHSTLAFGSGASVFCIGCIVLWAIFPKPAALCPKCACDWNQETDNSSSWLDWTRCPRCGLDLTPDDSPSS